MKEHQMITTKNLSDDIPWRSLFTIKEEIGGSKSNPTRLAIYKNDDPTKRVTCNSDYMAFRICCMAYELLNPGSKYKDCLVTPKVHKKSRILCGM